MQNPERRLMVVGGGTGGHLFPGIAVAEAWARQIDGGQVVFVGSPTGIEARVVPEMGYPFVSVEARRLKNAGVVERLKSLLRAPLTIWKGYQVIRRQKPSVVLGVGGYISGPVVLAAALAGRPCAVAEQNARPGLTNRILGRFVKRIYTAFPEAGSRFPKQKVRELGNPVRGAFLSCDDSPPASPLRILILGGSQGAKALNENMPAIMSALQHRFSELHVIHQTGRDRDQPVRELYAHHEVSHVNVVPFIQDMASAISQAHLVVARAGATTVAELACLGRPAVFIPFPFAADDHQAANAQSLVDAGAAYMQREEAMTTDGMVELLAPLLEDPKALQAMGRAARERGRPEAADAIVSDLVDLGGLDSMVGGIS